MSSDWGKDEAEGNEVLAHLDEDNKKGKRLLLRRPKKNRCPICKVLIPEGHRTCEDCAKVLKANPHLTVVDLM